MANKVRRPLRYRRLRLESLERRHLLAALTLPTIADGMVVDTNNNGTFDFVDSTSPTVSNRWLGGVTSPGMQERGVFEFDLRQIQAGSTINSASFAFDVQSFTFGNDDFPQVILRASLGDGSVTLGDATAPAVTIGTGSITTLGATSVALDRTLIESYIGHLLTVRLENSRSMGHWASIYTMEHAAGDLSARLVLDVTPPPSIDLQVSPASVWESDGAGASTGTITRTGDLSQPLVVTLSSSVTSAATVPATVTIPANETSVTFPIDAVDNFFANEDQVSTISASAVIPTIGPLTIDPSYGLDGFASTSLRLRSQFPRAAMAMTSDGKVLAASEAASSSSWQITRLNADGTVDKTFGTNGVVTTALNNGSEFNPVPARIAIQPDGSFLVGGKFSGGYGRGILVRYTASGQLDSSFGTNGVANLNVIHGSSVVAVSDIALRPDGRILLGFTENGTVTGAVAQLNPNGTLDPTFGVGGISRLHTTFRTGFASEKVELLADGTFLVAGAFQSRAGVVHVQANGSALVDAFGNDGIALADFNNALVAVTDLQLDSQGRIVYAASATRAGSQISDFAVARFLPSGAPDTTFAGDGTTVVDIHNHSNDISTAMVIQAGDKITLGGVSMVSNVYDSAIARLNADGTLDSSLDFDGRYRNSLVNSHSADLIVGLTQQHDGKLLALTGWAADVRVVRFIHHPPIIVSASRDVTVRDDDPTAHPQSLSIPEDTVLNGQLLATDPNQDPLKFLIMSGPSSGTVEITDPETGMFTYVPDLDFHGNDSFTFQVNDGKATSNIATVTIQVTPVNDPPVAVDTWIITEEDTSVSGQVEATDVDGDELTYSVVTQPTKGTLVFDPATGAYTYSPGQDVNGADSFTFKANDGQADSNIATVSIAINAVNDPPVVQPATFTLPEHSAVGTLVGTVVAADVDGDPLNFSIASGNTNGAFQIDASSGEIRVANSSAIDFETTPIFALVIRATDPGGLFGEAEVTIYLTDVIEDPGIQIDIVPNDPSNTIDLAKDAWVTVAILGNQFLDVTQVDIASLRFGASGTEASVERDGKGAKASFVFELVDTDGDGYLDLVVRFDTKQTKLTTGDTEAKLSGALSDGTTFLQAQSVHVISTTSGGGGNGGGGGGGKGPKK